MKTTIDYRVDLALIHSLSAPDNYLKKKSVKILLAEKECPKLGGLKKVLPGPVSSDQGQPP